MSISFYSHTCYKKAVKQTVVEAKKRKSHLTLAKIAGQLPVQYTFLSKALNDSKAHLNEDHLFKIGQLLELLPEEIDFLLLLRSHSTATSGQRREHLEKKIEKIRKERILSADHVEERSERLRVEMNYMMNPHCMLVQTALFIPEYKKNPQRLAPLLGLSLERLKDILLILEQNEYLLLGKDPFDIQEIFTKYPHYGPDHSMVRTHQQLLKSALLNRLSTSPEAQKESMLFTFTMDDETYLQVKERFRQFVQEVQKMTFNAKHKNVYQLSFDLLKWF